MAVPGGKLTPLQVVVVDLVADPVPAVDEDDHAQIGTARIRVASRYEILVEKLCALLSRTELRDLQDVQALVDADTDLRRAVEDAPRRDGGFSPLTMSWVLRGFDVHALAKAVGTASEEADRLEDFREELIDMLVQLTKPEE